jgi:hypothetical protein
VAQRKKPEIKQQYGIRWPTGSVFAFQSREDAEEGLRKDGRGIGALVVMSYDPATHKAVSEWQEVED